VGALFFGSCMAPGDKLSLTFGGFAVAFHHGSHPAGDHCRCSIAYVGAGMLLPDHAGFVELPAAAWQGHGRWSTFRVGF
jgi:hypothetical protein